MDNLDQDLGGLPVPTKNVTDDNKKSSDLGGLPVPKKKDGTLVSSDITSQSTSNTGWEDKIKQIKEGLINAPSKSTSQFNEPGIEKYVPTNPELAKAAGVETKKGLYEIQNPELAKEAGVEPIKQTKTLIIGKEMPIKHAPNVKRVKSPAQILKEEQDLKNQAINNTIAIRKKSETAINTAWTEDKEKKDIEYKLATGEYEVGADPKTGTPTIMRAVDQGYFNTLWDTYNEDYNRTLDNQAFTKLPKQDAINQLNVELWQEETNQPEYLPYKNKGILPWLGEKTAEIGGPLLKAGAFGIGALTGAGRAAGGLETATASALRASRASQAGNVLSFIQDMGFSGYTDNLKRTYKDLKKQNPQMSDEEAFDKAQKAGYFGEAAGIGAGAAMGGTFSKLKDAVTKVEVQPFINSLKHLGGEGLKQGGYASLSSLVTDLGAKSQGYRISPKDILENSINRGIDMAALTYVLGGTGLAAKEIIQSKHTAAAVQAMGIVSGAIKVPKPIIAQAKQVVSQLPLDEVQKIYQTAEDSGVLPEGSTEKAMTGLNNFIKTEFQVPEGLSEELKASLKGIQEKINNLEESKSKLDKTYHPYMDEQIKKEREKAQKILETGDVFKNEVDDLGNPIENTKESLEEKDITVGEILDKRGTYNEENGQFFQDGQTVIFKPDNSNKIYEIGNVDEINDIPISKFGIKNEESVVTINDNGNLEVRGTEYINNYSDPLKAINKDKDGNVVSVNLETSKGQKRTFRGNVAEDLAYQINLGKNAKVEELPISPETQKPITIGFAPFREKNVLDIAQDQEIRNSPDYKLHQENLQKLAEGLGIPIVNKADTWGGYVDGETGRPVQEVSNVMQIEAKPDEARLMAAILGKAAPEKQDSVLIGNYDDNGVGFEHVIKIGNFEDAKNALNLLKDNGLEYFTVDKDSGDIIILDTNAEKTQNVINFVKQLNENGIKSEHEYQPINGEFVEQKDYDSIIAGERGKERQQKGFDIDAFIQEASGKYQEIKAQAEKAQATQSLADKIRSLKTEKGTLNLLPDLGLTKAIYDGALEFLAKQVEKGTKFGKAIQDTIEWIDKNVKGSNWDKELFSRHAISLSTESSVEAGKTQPAMILTAKKKGIEEITHAGENSLVALRKNKPDMYISRAEEISKSNLVLGKVRKYNSNWTSEQKLKWSDEVYNKAKSTVVSNLLYLYDNIPEKVRTISKLWYDGANKIAKEFANKYDITHEQSAAVIASQSPQKPWFDNLHLAHFIMDYNHNNKDAIFTKEAFDYYKKTGENYPAQVAYFKELEKSIGKKYSELSNYDKSVLIRNEFDNKYDRTAPLRLPTGHIVGRTKSNSSFSGYDTIVKAISILNDGSEKNISDNLGGASKVRNFNNNIIDPNSEKFATIDTHAMAAGYFLPLGSKSPEVKFDPATYSFFHDAYSEAAKQRGVLPREMQSITWEGVKSLFPPSDKTEANKSQARELWNKYKNGEITLEELQKTIKENGKDLSKTDWSGLIDRSLKEGETGGFIEELPLNSRGRETGGQGVAGRPTTEVPTMEGRVEPTISEKGKKIADTLRKGKIILDKDVLQSNIAGVPIALYNTVIETIAKAIEAGSTLTEAIVYAIEKHKLGNINEFNKSEFVKKVADITGEKIEIKETEKEIEVEAEVAPRLVSGVSHKALQDIAENLGLPEVERGTGLTPKEYAERGRAFINSGVNPEDIAAQFKITKKANADDISIVRAYAEDLLKAADDARSEFGENSKEFKNAKRIYDNWTRNVVKPMGTAAGQSFTALQGGTDIDTGSFVQMQSAYEEKTGKPLTEEQKLQIEKLTTDNKNLTTKLKDLTKKLTEVINKAVNEQVKVEEKEVGKVKEEFKKIARFIRKGKLSRPDIFSAATPASLVWDGALEVAAKTVEVSGDIAQAIADGVEHVKNSDWYKNLNANQQKDAQKAFVDYVKENSEDKTAKRIQRLEAELDDLRNRREKETKNKELIEKTQKELDLEDQIKSEKRVIKLEEELQDIVDGKEKEPTKKQKREKTQRELDLENKIEKAKFENFTKRFVDKTDSNFNVEDVRDIWNYAKSEYLDKDASFEEMLSGVAKDLGLSTKQVRDAITLPKQARTISDEMYSTINKRKAAIAQAKSYVQNAGQSKATGFFKSIPSFFFKLKTAGHGTVGGITHAGMNLFQPSEYKTYFPFFIKQFNFAFGKIANYERAMEDLKNDSSFKFWKDAGLAIDPSEKYDDYQGEFIKQSWWDKLGAVGNRGFNALKVYRLDLAKSFYDGLSASEKADPNTAKELAKLVNHATGTSEINTPKWTSTAFFAPKLEISRWQGLIGDPVKATKTFLDWGNATPAEKVMAKRVAKNAGEKIATYIALLTANAGILAATGSKDKINFDDPSKGDWLKFKIAGKTIDPTGGIEATMRFIYTMMNSAQTAYTGTKKELRRKPQETQFQTVGTQLRYKLSPFASTAMDIFTGTDAMGRPLPWSKVKPRKGEKPYTIGGYLAQQQTPIPVSEALHEVKSSMKEKGMDDAQINDILKGIGVGLISGGTGVKVQDVPKEKKRY
jgi:hypothetical protein